MDAQGPLERALALEGADDAEAYAEALRALAAALRAPESEAEVKTRMTRWLLPALGLPASGPPPGGQWAEAMWDAAVDALADGEALATFLDKVAAALSGARPTQLSLLAMLRTRVGWRARDKLRRRDRYDRRFGARLTGERATSTPEHAAASLVVSRVCGAFADEPRAAPVLTALLMGDSVSDVSRDTGISRQAIYRLLARMRAWIEGTR